MDIGTVNKSIGDIASQGLLGSVAVLAIIFAGFCLNGWLKEKDKRVTDAQTVSNSLSQPLKNIQNTLDGIQTILQAIVNK